MKDVAVIATSRSWVPGLADRVASRSGYRVTEVLDPADLTLARLQELDPAVVFFPHWSTRIPVEIHEAFECVIFHMTDLPFGRGGSPLQNLLVRGIHETQMSAIRCETGLDSGPIYLKCPLTLEGSAEEIYVRSTHLIEDMIVAILRDRPEPQPQSGVPTVFSRRLPAESRITTATSIAALHDFIRMLDAPGYPRAFLEVGNLRIEFHKALLEDDCVRAEARFRIEP